MCDLQAGSLSASVLRASRGVGPLPAMLARRPAKEAKIGPKTAILTGLGRVFASIGPVLEDVPMLAGRHNDQKGGEKGHESHFKGHLSAWSGDKRGKSGENRGRGAVEKTPEPTRALKRSCG